MTQYLPRPGDRPRLIVLIGTFNLGIGEAQAATLISENAVSWTIIGGFPGYVSPKHECMSSSCQKFNYMFTGSVGARISELKQQVIAENPRRYGLAVPRECFTVWGFNGHRIYFTIQVFMQHDTTDCVLSVKQPPSLEPCHRYVQWPLRPCLWPVDTTRARKCHEREGIEYHFITRAAFESDIHNGK